MSSAAQHAAKQAARQLRRKVLTQMAAGAGVMAVPVAAWWYWARHERAKLQEDYRTRVRLPVTVTDTYDYLIAEKCQAGDVLLFDRRCERCAASPYAALACIVSKMCLTNNNDNSDAYIRSVDSGSYDHAGLIVPGYVKTRADEYDPTNLLLLEATASGIVARPLKERLEQSASQSVLLLQLCSPGEQRNRIGESDTRRDAGHVEKSPSQMVVARARAHVERELQRFRDQWIKAGDAQGYQYLHSTVTLGGAVAYALGLQYYLEGPVSPAAYLVLTGLQQAAAAPSITEAENRAVKSEDFLRDYRFTEKDAVRLRPGWRFLAPIPLKQSSSSSSGHA